MCGRYYVDDETAREIERLVRDVDTRMLQRKAARDVAPTAKAPVITGRGLHMTVEEQKWGLPRYQGSGVIFNARSETALTKPIFSDSVKNRRLIIPATGFYEWNQNKDKYFFRSEEGHVLLFAGFYQRVKEMDCFVILTTAANDSMKPVHERMPLILKQEEVSDWLFRNQQAEKILRKRPKELMREVQGQMTLLD